MSWRNRGWHRLAILVAVVLLAAGPGFSAGFEFIEQGTKALGLASAFIAQADDPSAMFYNVGGLAFLTEREFLLGGIYVTSQDATFEGSGAFPGPGVTAEQEALTEILPHFYWVEPVAPNMSFGLSLNSPFGLKTEWMDVDNFPGRFINTKAELKVVDLSPNFAWQTNPRFGVGVGLIYRMSSVELNNRQAAVTPFGPVEFAAVNLTSDTEPGFGWQAGILHKYNNSFSWGLNYRSEIEINYQGDALFTQVPTGSPFLDALFRSQFPFFDTNIPAETSVTFPAKAGLGVAFALGPTTLMEIDANWIGWSSYETLAVSFPFPDLDFERTESWDDSYNYRLGLLFGRGKRSEWRFGFLYDESPQPERAVSPLLPDANRTGYSIGWGSVGPKYSIDLALMYVKFDERTNSMSQDGFYGTYNQTGYLFGGSFGW